jgi:YfiH family protein
VGDDPAVVERNLRLLADAAGLDRENFRAAVQVHGNRLLHANGTPHDPTAEADAILASTPGLAPAVKTADCVPILLADELTGQVAAVHAGWRGTSTAIVTHAVEALVAGGARRESIVAAVGPAIGRCCYEVSPELAASFLADHGAAVVEGRRLDLPEANRLLLIRAGMLPDRIDMLGRCTSCEPDLFFSHRRDAGRTGRHLSFVVARGRRPLS